MIVLIVDDSAGKRKKVADVVRETVGQQKAEVVEVESAADAATVLETTAIDLMILDLNLPVRVGAPPTAEAGFQLLKQISRGLPRFRRPTYILGMTGFGELFQKFDAQFASEGWQLVHFDDSSRQWSESLTNLLIHIASAGGEMSVRKGFDFDLAIVTALKPVELEAVLRLDAGWTETLRVGDGTIYHVGEFERDGKRLKVVAAAAFEMGMAAAACLSMKVIEHFRPRWLGMAGIAAGVGLEFGDIVVADQSWDYGSGKTFKKGKESRFSPAPSFIPLDAGLKEKFELFIEQRKPAFASIQNGWPGNPVKTALKARVGPMASGAAVVENAEVLEAIKKVNRKLIGIEMETFGVFQAARLCTEPQPKPFSAKAVCDFGKPPKKDDHQRYAAYTSAHFIYEFALDQLV